MISLSHLNKSKEITIFFTIIILNSAFAADPVDIWKKKENQNEQTNQIDNKKEIIIKSPILTEDVKKITIEINEQKIDKSEKSVIGIFDPEDNNFSLNMWSDSDGEDIKNILKRINKLKLSKLSEDLLFQVLFTNAYPPKTNLTSEEFLEIKINWLIKNQRLDDLETLLNNNPIVGREAKAVKFLVDKYLSSANIKSACEKISFIDKNVQNNYLDKFRIYCLVENNQKNEAQLNLDLLIERGLKDKFFVNKINFLLGFTDETTQKILDDNLLNFYLSHVTSDNFEYIPNDKTDQNIWRYLSSANLIQVNEFEDEDIILTYEQAAAEDTFEKDEIYTIYLKIFFNFNQLINVMEIHKTLPNYKARALVYQSILLSSDIEKKLDLTFLLKDLFVKDKLLNVYSEELSNILKAIDPDKIPEKYRARVKQNLAQNLTTTKQIKFNNDILHRSKVIRHFLDDNEEISRTEKDFKSVYKKIKKNKKYFLSIKDITVLESLKEDGVSLPEDIDFGNISSQLTIPQNLEDLVIQKQTGLVMLKIIEIIGEDNIRDLDPETIYFLNSILNKLKLKKIRNNILSQALPIRV